MKKIKLLLTAVFVLSSASMYAQQYSPDSDFRIDWDKDAANAVIITKYIGSRSDVRIPPKIQNNTVTQIANNAFEKTGIISVTIPDSVTSIGERAFYNCTKLASVTIPNSVKFIWPEAFKGCTSLTSITIPESVTRIMSEAFYDCTNLTSVTFGKTPRWFMGGGAFDGNLEFEYGDFGKVLGPGTYTRFAGGKVWKPNFTPQEVAARQADEQVRRQEQQKQSQPQQQSQPQKTMTAHDYYERASAAMEKKDYDKAIDDLTQAIRLDLNNSTYYNNRGSCYFNIRNYNRAIDDYTQAIWLNPNSTDAYNNRGLAYKNKKDYDKAIADYTSAIRLNPN